MSDENDMDRDDIKRDDPMLAAEFSLGLLEGEELLSARGKLASDPDFAWRKQWWDNWFAPWTDEISGAEPSADVWGEIEARVLAASGEEASGLDGANVVELQSKVRRWQWVSALTTAAAVAALALVVLPAGTETIPTPGATEAPQIAAADPLVAQVPIGDTGLRLDVTYMPDSERMLVGAIGLTADGVHDHELWLVPADGSALQSLGVVTPGEVRSVTLPAEITQNMGSGVELVLTREPIGGKPVDQDAGPVVAQGAFTQV